MNELFETHKKLNIKKVILVIVIIIFLIISMFDVISNFLKNNNDEQPENHIHTEAQNPNSIFYDANNKISVELSKKYELQQYSSTNDYLIELRSPNNLDIFIARKPLIENRTLLEVASADSKAYIENFKSNSNLSNLSDFKIGNKMAYTYSFHYLDNSTKVPYYLQVVWLEVKDYYYVFDIEFPLDNLENYKKIVNETLNSFTEIEQQ